MPDQRNDSTVQAIYDAFARGDVAAVMSRFSPEIEWITPASLPWSSGRYHGHAGVGEYFQSFLGALESPEIRPDELVVAGDRVVAYGHERARARTTGKPFSTRFVHTWTFADGKVVRLEGIVDTAVVREAFAT